jgi:hypothetical protein
MKHKAPYILIAGVVLVIGAVFAFGNKEKFLCPDDYATADDQTAGMVAWENHFFDQHPDASLTDMAEARHQFYIDHNCTAALQRYNEAKAMEGQNH